MKAANAKAQYRADRGKGKWEPANTGKYREIQSNTGQYSADRGKGK